MGLEPGAAATVYTKPLTKPSRNPSPHPTPSPEPKQARLQPAAPWILDANGPEPRPSRPEAGPSDQVRHWREGAVESSRSKAHLLAAAHEVAGGTPNVDYFPAFELLMDELRDYRWYNVDMLHPSPAAEQFIFERLLTACFRSADAPLRAEVGKLRRAAAHRPLHPHGDGSRAFAAAQLAQATELARRHPHLDAPLAEVVAHFRAITEEKSDGVVIFRSPAKTTTFALKI